ncbi:MAG TPA: BlaI/MecI/CopY family transcriptional regulator [Candidatus Krumholzibacteria bacterium]|nr:BlaI/MecI/CopY family transcriptional regulator [Candidatus Krumholzibacteria bacterium]
MRGRKPTNAELAILRVLWRQGPSTVRQVHQGLERGEAVGYTTVLKLLQIMVEKGLVRRDASSRSHVYTPRTSEGATQRRLVQELLERAFSGSALGLVMQALSAKPPSASELQQLRDLLDGMNGGEG